MAQVGIQSGGALRDHDHSASGAGGQLNPESALNPQPKVEFGDGADGDFVTVAELHLTRDMSYNNLTVNHNVWAAGYKLKVKGKLTVAAGCHIFANDVLDTGSAGAAGVGGNGAGAAYGTRRISTYLPTAGAKGANGPAPAGIEVSNGGAGGAVALPPSTVIEGRVWVGGGGGGGGAVGTAPAAGAAAGAVKFGAAGGAGGNAVRTAGNHTKGGGGGGAGGGCLEIWAYELENNGTLYAAGGNGGAGEGDVNAEAGGGGGGGGGACLIHYRILTGLGIGAVNVAGGLGGPSFSGAADGAPGAAGIAIAEQI